VAAMATQAGNAAERQGGKAALKMLKRASASRWAPTRVTRRRGS